jgi:hypothetical protein
VQARRLILFRKATRESYNLMNIKIRTVAAVVFFSVVLSIMTAQPTPGNYPDTSIPLSTDTTVTPDAAPTNTTSINVSASTNFKGKLEGYPATGVVRVTDAHPAGTYTVTVRAFDSGGASATKTFTLTVTTPATCTPVSFAAPTSFGVDPDPYSVAVGDFNGDGNQDLAVANQNGNDVSVVSVLLGDGAGSFSAPTNFSAGTYPLSVAVGDFNGDGKQDLAVANVLSDNVSILLGDGAGSFSAPTNFGVGHNPYSVAVGDFNGDGKQDLAVANYGSNNVSILLGNGAGSFSAATNFGAGNYPSSVAVGDFNGDGKQDLATANATLDNVSILLGNGAGSFSAATNFGVGSGPFSVVVGDFNGDGKQDLAVANTNSNNVSILLRNCGALYNAQIQQPINPDGSSVFNVRRGVVPVKFTLTQNGTPTCALPAATIAVTRTAGGTTGEIDESVYSGPADTGSNFRINGCQYIYNLTASALGVGTYRVDIKINNQVVGSAVLQLK